MFLNIAFTNALLDTCRDRFPYDSDFQIPHLTDEDLRDIRRNAARRVANLCATMHENPDSVSQPVKQSTAIILSATDIPHHTNSAHLFNREIIPRFLEEMALLGYPAERSAALVRRLFTEARNNRTLPQEFLPISPPQSTPRLEP